MTTTAGNADAEQCAVNAAWVLEQCGVSTIPVSAGTASPFEVALTTTPEAHGETGLGYVDAPPREVARNCEALWIDATSRTDDLLLICYRTADQRRCLCTHIPELLREVLADYRYGRCDELPGQHHAHGRMELLG